MSSSACRLAALLPILTALALPIKAAAPWEQTGIASWYGGIFQGRITANGETYDTYGYTCAHKTLPFNTLLEVENLGNGHTVRVRVNDRGPFVEGRIIDLTYAAAAELDMIRDGTVEVRITAVEESIPEVRFNIQVGAWGTLENAVLHRKRLEEAGLEPTAALSDDGITRLSIAEVAEADVFPLAQILEELGYTDLFIYQVSE